MTQDVEYVEPSHPLILWIRDSYDADQSQLHRVTALKITAQDAGTAPGDYVFCAHRWSFTGFRSDHLLAFRVIRLGEPHPLSSAESEDLVTRAARHASLFPNAINMLESMDTICAGAVKCEQALSDAFGERLSDFYAENTLRCDQQETSARKFAERRIEELQRRIDRFRAERNCVPSP